MKKNLLPFLFLLFMIMSCDLNAQTGWFDSEPDTVKTTVFAYAPRIGYSHFSSGFFEAGYGIYICHEDNTIEDPGESNLKNILQISNSFNLTIEYSSINKTSVWAPKFSYVMGFALLAIRGDLLWQTHDFKKGYFGVHLGAGIGFYNLGIFAMKNISLNNNNPYQQKWGISIAAFIFGGHQKWIPRR